MYLFVRTDYKASGFLCQQRTILEVCLLRDIVVEGEAILAVGPQLPKVHRRNSWE